MKKWILILYIVKLGIPREDFKARIIPVGSAKKDTTMSPAAKVVKKFPQKFQNAFTMNMILKNVFSVKENILFLRRAVNVKNWIKTI